MARVRAYKTLKQHTPIQRSQQPYQIQLSPQAVQHLTALGIKYNYIHPQSTTIRGIGPFLDSIASYNTASQFIDTRPPQYVDETLESLEAGILPTWYKWPTTYPHRIQLRTETIAKYVEVAHRYAIKRLGYSRIALTSAVIEAIGTGWLTPSYWPTANITRRQQRNRDTYHKSEHISNEFDWFH